MFLLSHNGDSQDLVFLNNYPQMTLMQPNILESVSLDVGSRFHGKTLYRKRVLTESFPPGNILSAICKTPQAVKMGHMARTPLMAFWILEGGRVQPPFPKE